MSEEEKVVCVTGASGFIASWFVKLLLQHGYTVRATVRDPNDPKKTEHLLALDGAKERPHLFKAELLDEGAFDSLVDGCIGVFHMASPCFYVVKDPQLWYVLSKMLADEAAWKYTKENSIDMVSINPGLVIGPLLQPTVNASVEPILKLIKGAETFPNATYRLIDVRDAANAHILAFENSSACGRYLLVEKVVHCSEIVEALRKLYPALSLPEKCADEKLGLPVFQVSKDRAKSLGINFTPLEVSIKDTVESLKEKNFFSG